MGPIPTSPPFSSKVANFPIGASIKNFVSKYPIQISSGKNGENLRYPQVSAKLDTSFGYGAKKPLFCHFLEVFPLPEFSIFKYVSFLISTQV